MTQPASASPPGGPPPPPATEGAPPADGAPEEILPRKFGKYTLLRKLAVGGMAELYLSLHRSVAGFEKLVVIKRVLPNMAKDQGFITMLLQEARIAATFSHPNIVTIFDVGQADKSFFIAMEHIHGEDLRSIVRAMKPKSVTEFPIEHAITIVMGVAAGLAYAHEKTDLNGNSLNIVHRDISPQNVLVTFTGDVKVVDFGIAKATQVTGDKPEVELKAAIEEGKESEHHTKVGQLKGKVPYMSPEQARGEPLDPRSDIFSLGVMLFELCTGRRLFRGPNEYETLKMITEGEYPLPSQVNPRISPALEAVIMKALAKDVRERYQLARELQGDLERVARDERIPVSTLSLGTWMQMLFEEKLAAQREALLQGKQLADVLAAEEPENFTEGGTLGGSMQLAPAAPPSKVPWIVAVLAVLAIAVGGGAFVVRERRRQAEEAQQRAINSGTIVVSSTPPGASIWLNGSPTPHRTPYTLRDLATGPNVRYSIRLTVQGRDPIMQEVRLPARNARATVTASLELARASSYAVLEVATTPPGATVIVDGRQIQGATPLTVPELEAGVEHVVLVHHPDMTDETFRFLGAAGNVERRALQMRERPLAPDEAFVNIVTEPANARLRVGERDYIGSPFHVRIRAGQPTPFAFTAPGFESARREFRARAGQTVEAPMLRLERPASGAAVADTRPGTLRIGARPWCNVSVDGRDHGQSPVDVTTRPGWHNVVCVNPARGTRSQRVNLAPAGNQRVLFTF